MKHGFCWIRLLRTHFICIHFKGQNKNNVTNNTVSNTLSIYSEKFFGQGVLRPSLPSGSYIYRYSNKLFVLFYLNSSRAIPASSWYQTPQKQLEFSSRYPRLLSSSWYHAPQQRLEFSNQYLWLQSSSSLCPPQTQFSSWHPQLQSSIW